MTIERGVAIGAGLLWLGTFIVSAFIEGAPEPLPAIALGSPWFLHLVHATFVAAGVLVIGIVAVRLFKGEMPSGMTTKGISWSETESTIRASVDDKVISALAEMKTAIESIGSKTGTPAAEGVQRAVEDASRSATVADAVSRLPEREKVAFILHTYEGLSNQDIALTLGLSRQTVAHLIHRAMKRIRDEAGEGKS